jgi:glycosyltransferase involved in cell wall biosynthesis
MNKSYNKVVKPNDSVTLLMPVLNGEKYLNQAKQSLVANCEKFDEILIIDDGSIDSTSKILQSWCRDNPNIRIVRNSKSSGLVNALNLGIAESANKWIARFDVDDIYPTYRLSKCREILLTNPVAIFTDYSFISEKNTNLGYMPSAIFKNQTYLSLVSSQRTAHPSVMFNKEAVVEVGGYRTEDFPAEDISLWLRLSKLGEIQTVPIEGLRYRLSGNSITGQGRNEAIAMKNKLVANFKFEQEIIEECIESLETTYEKYSHYSYSSERYLLHLRDLFLLRKLGKLDNVNDSKLRFVDKNLFNPNSIFSGFKIFTETVKRRIYRNFIL